MDNKTQIRIIFPLALTLILAVAANYIPLKLELSGAQQEVLNFIPDDLKIREIQNISSVDNMKSPIDFASAPTGVQPDFNDDLVPRLDYNDKSLSLVVISGSRKMAVINGSLFREGETVDGITIAKIEPGRVMLKDKGSKWLYLENETH